VEKTHSGLGNAMAMAIVCVKARECLLLVSPSGCGKSVITDTLAKIHPEAYPLLSITKARLSTFKDVFSNFKGVVVMDDMASAGSMYERKETLVAFSVLCYSHFISKHTFSSDFEITDFHGATVMNIQPAILAEIYTYPEWESLLREKTLRYYHLYRPTKPCQDPPSFKVDWGIDMDLVKKPDYRYKLYSKVEAIAGIQWGDARLQEHVNTLLRASAALAQRQVVTNDDFALLYRLMKPMTVERYVMHKTGFEVGRWMDTNLAATLVEFASWKNISIERIARDYKISPSTVYQLLSQIREWFVASETMTKRLVPKPELKKVLKEAGVER